MGSRLRWAASVTVIVPMLLATGGCGSSSDEEQEGGPLQGAERDALGIPATVDAALTFSVPVVYNVGDSDVTLDRLELDQPDAGVEHVGTLATGNSRRLNYDSSDEHFPPTDPVFGKPGRLAGTTVAPVKSSAGEAGVELLVGLRPTRPGRLAARGLVMRYHEGDKRWRVRIPQTFALCATRKALKRPPVCDAPPVPARDATKVGRK